MFNAIFINSNTNDHLGCLRVQVNHDIHLEVCVQFIIFNTRFIILNTKFINLNTEIINFDTNRYLERVIKFLKVD